MGKAKNLKKRITSYFSKQGSDLKTISLVKQIHHIDFTVTTSEQEAVLLECNLIKQYRPRYNILLRDDKSYPYIIISHHPYPRIDLYRGQRRKDGHYFGPYPSAYAVRETIQLLQKLFRIRTCRDSYFAVRSRPCLLYQIDRCTGPCVKLISIEAYAKQIELAILFLQGKSDAVTTILQQQMTRAAEAKEYELAGSYRDQIARVRQIQHKQYVAGQIGDADVLGFSLLAGVACIQVLSIRDGQVLTSRSYFPSIPAQAEQSATVPEEILTAFIAQYYLREVVLYQGIPKQIILPFTLSDQALLQDVLSRQATYRIKLIVPSHGEKQKWLAMAANTAKQTLAAHLMSKANMEERLRALQDILNLPMLPARLECFDISHMMGEATVASCVVFNSTGPLKSDYRRYNIEGITPGDDVAAMRQVLERRFKKGAAEEKCPDIIFIDGGKTQLSAVNKVISEKELVKSPVLIGVSKGEGRKPGYESLHFISQPSIHLPADSSALHFIQHIRDEAHRFAITGHRQRRDKVRNQSILESIPGVGPKKRRELLRYFGGIQGVAHASLEELSKVPGISRSLAEKLFAILHDTPN